MAYPATQQVSGQPVDTTPEFRLRKISQAASLPREMTGEGANSGLRMAGAGLQFAAALIAGVYAGQWLDRRFAAAPVFLYLGVALGAVGGMTALIRQLNRFTRDDEEARRK